MSDQTSSRTPATQDANAPTPASDNSLAWSVNARAELTHLAG